MSQQKGELLEDLRIYSDINCNFCGKKMLVTDEIVKIFRQNWLFYRTNGLNTQSRDLMCIDCNYYILTSFKFNKIAKSLSQKTNDNESCYKKIIIGKKAAITWFSFNEGYTIVYGNKKWKIKDIVNSINDMHKILKKIETLLMLL